MKVTEDVFFRLSIADAFEMELIGNRFCNPPIYRKSGESDIDLRIRIRKELEKEG